MFSVPPSYRKATSRDIWPIVAPFLDTEGLLTACLVCRHWHKIFSGDLWGNPTANLGMDHHSIHLSLMRLGDLLPEVRIEIRSLVKILNFPSIQSIFLDNPQIEWLKNFLKYLPNLQSIIVSNSSFFDHQSLLALGQETQITEYPLKLLDASYCINTTTKSLFKLLSHLPKLIYLDLSATQGTKSLITSYHIKKLTSLCVLKMSQCGLRDDDIEKFSFPSKICSLDVSENRLTEKGIGILCEKLLSRPPIYRDGNSYNHEYSNYRNIPKSPSTRILYDSVERYILKRLISDIDSSQDIEEDLPTTFLELNLASNFLSINTFLKITYLTQYLQHLDIGNLKITTVPFFSSWDLKSREKLGVELLDPEVFLSKFKFLRSLRIHHSIITSNPFSSKKIFERQTNEETVISTSLEKLLIPADDPNLRSTDCCRSHSREIHQEYLGEFSPFPVSATYFCKQNSKGTRHPGRFRSYFLPNIRTLTLTGVPSHVNSPSIPDSIFLFIRECDEDREFFILCHDQSHNGNGIEDPETLKLLILEIGNREISVDKKNLKSSPSPGRIDIDNSTQKGFSFFKGKFAQDDTYEYDSLDETNFIDVFNYIEQQCRKLFEVRHGLTGSIIPKSRSKVNIHSSTDRRTNSSCWNIKIKAIR